MAEQALSPLQLRKLAAEKRRAEMGEEETTPQSPRAADQAAVLDFDVANSTGDWVSVYAVACF
jgi:hypothetical protein